MGHSVRRHGDDRVHRDDMMIDRAAKRFDLEGKVALVVGAGPGIGGHVARAYAAAGARVAVVARSPHAIESIVSEIEADGGEALALVADVADPVAVETMVALTEERFGDVNILFYNAYFFSGPYAFDADPFFADEEHWRASFEVNMLAPYRLTKRLFPGMQRTGYGAIVTVLSCAAFMPTVPQMAYGATKAGLHMLTRYLAKAGGGAIRANCICPGSIMSNEEVGPMFAQHIAKNAIARAGAPDEVVGAALFLASPASSYTTGQVIFCEGGRVNTMS